jgi:hypothetical protein
VTTHRKRRRITMHGLKRIGAIFALVALLALAPGCAGFAEGFATHVGPIVERAAAAAAEAAVETALDRLEKKLDGVELGVVGKVGEVVRSIHDQGAALVDDLKEWAEKTKPRPGTEPTDPDQAAALLVLAALGGGAGGAGGAAALGSLLARLRGGGGGSGGGSAAESGPSPPVRSRRRSRGEG